jgi:FixJ family two-component response regulator
VQKTEEVVYVVDNDPRVGEALCSLIRANGKRVQMFTSGKDFLDWLSEEPEACSWRRA